MLFTKDFVAANNRVPCNSSILFCDTQSTDCFISNEGNITCHCKFDYTQFNSSLCIGNVSSFNL